MNRALDARVRAAFGWRYVLCPDELRFVRALLTRHSRMWCWRTDQAARAGDFALVDMSSPEPADRTTFVVDVKLSAPLIVGGGGGSNQLNRASEAMSSLRRTGVIEHLRPPVLMTGDRSALIEALSRRTAR